MPRHYLPAPHYTYDQFFFWVNYSSTPLPCKKICPTHVSHTKNCTLPPKKNRGGGKLFPVALHAKKGYFLPFVYKTSGSLKNYAGRRWGKYFWACKSRCAPNGNFEQIFIEKSSSTLKDSLMLAVAGKIFLLPDSFIYSKIAWVFFTPVFYKIFMTFENIMRR